MKNLAVIKNPLFKDYIRIVATDNLNKVIESPDLPVDFEIEANLELKRADELAHLLNGWFANKKLKNKDFIVNDDEVLAHLNFFMKLIEVATDKQDATAFIQENVVPQEESEKSDITMVLSQKVGAVENVTPTTPQVEAELESVAEQEKEKSVTVEEVPQVSTNQEKNMVEGLNIPVGAEISFVKEESIKANLIDEKNVVFDGVKMTLMDATKKAFKKAGSSGLPLGLANWNYEGKTLKAIKDELKD